MNFSCARSQNLSFATGKHNTHDESWLLPGVTSSFLCFACTIEGLEDKATLNIRKKKIASELLKVLLVNKNIGKVIASKEDVYFHLLNLYINLLAESVDQELNDLINQCCLHTVKQTNPLHAAPIVFQNLINRKGFSDNLHLIKLACGLTQISPLISSELTKKKGIYIEDIVRSASGCNNTNALYLWNLISLMLESGVKNSNIEIPREIIQLILVSGLDTIGTASVAGVEMHILNCLRCFAQSRDFRNVLFHHESSKLLSNSQSIVEVLKKMLLSSNEELEICAVRCVSSICDSNYESTAENPELTSLVSLVLEKGLSEFLLELLSSAGELVISELFQSLCKLTYSKIFCKMGHMVYGFSEIIKAILRVKDSSNLEVFYEGLVLLEAMFTQGIFLNHRSHLAKQSSDILSIIVNGFKKPLSKVKHILVSCFCVYLNHSPYLILNDYKTSFEFIESVFKYIEKDVSIISKNVDTVIIDFVAHSYSAVHLITQLVCKEYAKSEEKSRSTQETNASSSSSQLSQLSLDNNILNTIIDNTYFICDKYLVPQAVIKFLPLKNVELQSIFYRTLLSIIELSQEKGRILSLKAAQSSFIKTIFNFKVLVFRNSKDINDILAKLLLHLCTSVDSNLLDDCLQERLLGWLVNFNLPFSEWTYLLNSSVSTQQVQDNFLGETRSCIFALLVCSHRASAPMISIQKLMSHLKSFAENKESLFSLPILGKRYFLYLWCHIESANLDTVDTTGVASKHVIDMLGTENERIKILYMNTELMLAWILKNNVSLNLQVKYFEFFFEDILKDSFLQESDIKDKSEILVTLFASHGLNCKFIEVTLFCLATSTSNIIIDELISVFAVLINSFTSTDKSYCKSSIYKTFMTNSNRMEHFHLTALFKCLNELHTAQGTDMNDDDLKLFCKSLGMLSEHSAPSLKFQLLNFINILLAKSVRMHDAKPSSVLLAKKDVMLDFEASLFTNLNFIANSQSSFLLENTNAAIILIVSELLSGVQLLADFPTVVIKVHINLLVEALVCPVLPVIQVASLSFWKKVFALKLQSPLLLFVGDDSGEACVTQEQISLIYIALQNLSYNPKELIREYAADCLCALFDNLNSSDFLFEQPWTKTLIQVCVEKISCVEKDVASLRLLSAYLKYKDACEESIFNFTLEMLRKCLDESNILENAGIDIVLLMEVVIKAYAENIDYAVLKDLKSLLKSIHHKFSKAARDFGNENISFVSINGLVIVKLIPNPIEIIETIRKTKMIVCERISGIDDETDSGDDDY